MDSEEEYINANSVAIKNSITENNLNNEIDVNMMEIQSHVLPDSTEKVYFSEENDDSVADSAKSKMKSSDSIDDFIKNTDYTENSQPVKDNNNSSINTIQIKELPDVLHNTSDIGCDSSDSESISNDRDSDQNDCDSLDDKNNQSENISDFRNNHIYMCPRCSFEATSAREYLHHQVDCHRATFEIYDCRYCNFSTKNHNKFKSHCKQHFVSKYDVSDAESGINGSDLYIDEGELNDSIDNSLTSAIKDGGVTDSLLTSDESSVLDKSKDSGTSMPSVVSAVMPRRNPRQEVDPGKYVIVNSEKGVKYACSKCTSVYSWRKSLNKHWKEKHPGEVPNMYERAKKIAEVEEANNSHAEVSVTHKQQQTSLKNKFGNSDSYKQYHMSHYPYAAELKLSSGEFNQLTSNMPNVIGPFVTNTVQSNSFANSHVRDARMGSKSPIKTHFRPLHCLKSEGEALDLSKTSTISEKNCSQFQEISTDQEKPLDYSTKTKENISTSPHHSAFTLISHLAKLPLTVPVVNQPIIKQESASYNDRESSYSPVDNSEYYQHSYCGSNGDSNESLKNELQCNRCSYVAKTLVDFSSHMSIHMTKRAYKCAECQESFIGLFELNSHFVQSHSEKILEHKNICSKINTSLQSTFPVNQENQLQITSKVNTLGKSLKCSTCSFVAKWPAELQKHTVSHSEERPYICMVCGSTYKWKWDLVKHFEKSHHSLPNPYKRRDALYDQLSNAMKSAVSPKSDQDNMTDEPKNKKLRLSDDNANFLVMQQLSNDDIPNDKSPCADDIKCENLSENIESARYNDINKFYNNNTDADTKHFCSEDTLRKVTEAIRQKINNSIRQQNQKTEENTNEDENAISDEVLPHCCQFCDYRARWPSEITQHLKNHSNLKPYQCPRCNYRSKWKWDVVKHLKRCGGGTVKDVIVVKDENLDIKGLKSINIAASSPQSKYFKSLGLVKKDDSSPELQSYGDQKSEIPTGKFIKGIVNGSEYHCLRCPFRAESRSALTKHQIQHSENKPFSCGSCGYCSKWKGDVKKHLKAYNHTGIIIGPRNKSDDKSNKINEAGSEKRKLISSNGEEKEMYKCNNCNYITSEKFSFYAHSRIHSQPNITNPKFKCKQCGHMASDLTGFLTHNMSHSQLSSYAENDDETSAIAITPTKLIYTNTNDDELMEDIKLRNRRKPIQRFECSKCPFVCFKKSNFLLHKSMHGQTEGDFQTCDYCDYSVSSANKDLLLQHVALHENEFKISNYKRTCLLDSISENGVDSTGNETHADVNLSREELSNSLEEGHSLKCEWCTESFSHLIQLYEHAEDNHPSELKDQQTSPMSKRNSTNKIKVNDNDITSNLNLLQRLLKMTSELSSENGATFKDFKCPFLANADFSFVEPLQRLVDSDVA